MTVTIKQRKPDEITGERHDYTYHDVIMLDTYSTPYNLRLARMILKEGKTKTIDLRFFDLMCC